MGVASGKQEFSGISHVCRLSTPCQPKTGREHPSPVVVTELQRQHRPMRAFSLGHGRNRCQLSGFMLPPAQIEFAQARLKLRLRFRRSKIEGSGVPPSGGMEVLALDKRPADIPGVPGVVTEAG